MLDELSTLLKTILVELQVIAVKHLQRYRDIIRLIYANEVGSVTERIEVLQHIYVNKEDVSLFQ